MSRDSTGPAQAMEEEPTPTVAAEGKQGLLSGNNQTPNYDAVFGEEKQSSKFSQDTPFGKVRNVKRFSWVEWVFIGLASFAFLGTLGLTIERLVSFYTNFTNSTNNFSCHLVCGDWTCRADVTFAIVLIVNLMFCLYYAFDGVLREHGMEILAVPVATTVVLVYLLANYIIFITEHSVGDDVIKLIRLILAFVFGPPLIGFAIFIYTRTGKLRFTLVGSNKTLMKAYQFRSFLFTVTLFNLQLVVNIFVLSWTAEERFIHLPEKIILPIFTAYTLCVTVLGWFGFFYENRVCAVASTALFLLTVSYPVFKIVNVGVNYNTYVSDCGWDGVVFESIAISLFVTCSLAIIVYVLILVFSVLVILNFDQGLLSKVDPPLASVFRLIKKSATRKNSLGREQLVESTN